MQRRAALLSVLALAGAWGLGACHQREPRVVLIGDSTMADYPPARAPLSGWGQALRERLRGKAEVINRAVPGSSTLSYSRDIDVLHHPFLELIVRILSDLCAR